MSNIKKPPKTYPVVRLGIDQISDKPGKYCMSYGFNSTELKRSLSQVGLINYPYVIKNDGSHYEAVTGFRRIIALKELNIEEVECFDMTGSVMSAYDMLRFALHDNLFIREFNLVEKSMIFNMLIELVKDNNRINEFSSLLNVSRKDYGLILKIQELDEPLKESIASGTINIKALEQLVELKSDDILLCNTWITNLKLNYNQQIQFVDYINDISRIEKISIKQLLGEKFYLDISLDNKKNIPQKAKALMDNLRERRNPVYSNYKNLFEKKIKRMQLPPNIKIKHPRYFESEGYQVEIEFKNGAEIKKSLRTLLDIDELEKFEDPEQSE